MSVLSDGDILRLIREEAMAIEGFAEPNLTPNGYDCTIAEVSIPGSDIKISDGEVKIPPGRRFAVSTREYFRLGPGVCASLWIKTSWARKGVVGAFGKIDAGFEGNLTLLAYNSSDDEITVQIGNKFAQVVFESMLSIPQKLYSQRSGNYFGQKGVTLEPLKK